MAVSLTFEAILRLVAQRQGHIARSGLASRCIALNPAGGYQGRVDIKSMAVF
jgi:hypothetical protein